MTKSKMEGGMGFRDLAMFNDSLLAKHAWRLLQNSDSLFYKFFKARFFPNCSIMEVKRVIHRVLCMEEYFTWERGAT